MDPSLFDLVSKQYPALLAIVTAAGTVFASGVTTTILTQLMKLPFIPVAAKSYPRVTSVVFAILTSALATWLLNVAVVIDWLTFAVYAAVTLVVSWKVYDATYAVVDEFAHPKPPVVDIKIQPKE